MRTQARGRVEISGASVISGVLLVLAAVFAVIALVTPPPRSITEKSSQAVRIAASH